ncbi:NERD domain-containing protein [Flavobacteriaceae bacterium GF1]
MLQKFDSAYLYVILLLVSYVFFILFKKSYLPRIYGSWGEYLVARKLKRLNKSAYKVHNNVYLTKNGRTSQIDHLIISLYGIFVIETKNYKGWIFGNEKSKYWTQTLYKKKYKLYNPVIQNWKHINFLKSLSTTLKDEYFFPIVVFAGESKLKKIVSTVPVIKKRRLLRTIGKNKEVIITHQQLIAINEIIGQHLQTGRAVRKRHRKNVKEAINRNKKNRMVDTCPKCGSKLEVKDGKYGKFHGCTNFPGCRYTSSLNS